MNVVVRDAERADAAAIAEIYNEGIDGGDATFETEHRKPGDIEAWLEDGIPTVVGEAGGLVAAWAAAHPYRPARPVYRGVGDFSIYVSASARGRGVGRAVLQGLIQSCTRLGYWKLVGRTFPENSASRALCAAVGLREVGVYRRHAQLNGEWRDCVILELLLGEAAGGSPDLSSHRR